MNRSEKEEIIGQVKELISEASAIFLVDYAKVNVEDINKLRAAFRKEGVKYKVVKNTLVKKALASLGKYEKLNDNLVGMIGIAFAGENFIAPAKIIKKYYDEKQKFVFRGCYIDNEYYDASKLNAIATMPTKEEIIAGIIGSIAAPASGIVGSINAVMRDLVSVVDQISKKDAA